MIGVVVAVVAIGGYLASPLFYETEVNEPLPMALDKIEKGLTMQKFSNMDEQDRQTIVEKMPEKVRDMIMKEAATVSTSISEDMDDMMYESSAESTVEIVKAGEFMGLAGHNAQGIAKIIQVDDRTFLRFENFEVTNGPDLRVYITKDGNVKEGIHLEKLKGSRGDQNYLLKDIDIGDYDSVVIYCQPFGAYFGKAALN